MLWKWSKVKQTLPKVWGNISNRQGDMIAHIKEQHVNFANSVLNMAKSKAYEKKQKTEEEQREFDYFKALAVKLNTADVC